jgi:hypothetical protein
MGGGGDEWGTKRRLNGRIPPLNTHSGGGNTCENAENMMGKRKFEKRREAYDEKRKCGSY